MEGSWRLWRVFDKGQWSWEFMKVLEVKIILDGSCRMWRVIVKDISSVRSLKVLGGTHILDGSWRFLDGLCQGPMVLEGP